MTDPEVRERSIVQAPFFTDTQLKQRIEMNRSARFGLESASAAQLNVIFVLSKQYKLDPVTDITIYEGRPWITIEGWGRLLRRHPDFRGLECRPLTPEEREQWGYALDDLVIEACVKTLNWGEIRARGKVSGSEREAALNRSKQSGKRAAPIAVHPVEIAEKRAIARAGRLAFGQELPDDEQIADLMQTEITERTDPERTKALSAQYDQFWPADDQPAIAARPEPEATPEPEEATA